MLGFQLSGRWQNRLLNVLTLLWSSLVVTARRLVRGPLLPGWSWSFETATHFFKTQSRIAFDKQSIEDGREYLDALVFNSPALARVHIEPVYSPVHGHWYQPEVERDLTLLYFHGGGYAYYTKAHQNLIALATQASRARTFALDYPLIPEHPFPAQVEDAQAAYLWLLSNGVDPQKLVVMGDSAGGNLALALLLSLRNTGSPLPALGICISPWTDIGNPGESMTKNERFDWVEKRMAEKWSRWFCHGSDPRNPLISPVHADLRGLPPIYIQAGGAEILVDMIGTFMEQLKEQGGEAVYEVWENMNHDFQAYGVIIPESREALKRIEQVIDRYVMRETV